MKTLNPLSKNNIIHDMAMFAFILWLSVNYAYENYTGHTIYASLCMYLFLGLGAFWLLVKGRFTLMGNYFFVATLLMLMLILASNLYTPEAVSKIADRYTYRYFTNVVLTFILINLICDRKDMERALKAFVLGGVLIAILFYTTYGIDVFEFAELAKGNDARYGWEFGNVNLLAQKCTFSVVIAFYYGITSRSSFKKIMYLLISAVIFSVCLFSGSRKSLFVVVGTIIFMFLSNGDSKRIAAGVKKIFMILLVMTTIILVIMYVPAFKTIGMRMEALFDSFFFGGNMSVSEIRRMNYITKGLSQFLKKPFLGNGMCYSYYIFNAYTHNNFVEVLLSFGIVGFILHYYPYFASIRNGVLSKDRKGINILLLSIIVAILISDIGVVTYYDRNIAMLMAIISKYYTDKTLEKAYTKEE